MIKTNIKNFFVNDNVKFKFSNVDNYEKANIIFQFLKEEEKFPLSKEVSNDSEVFVFFTKNITKAGDYLVFLEYYNEIKDDLKETEPVGNVKILDKYVDPKQARVDKLRSDIEMLNNVITNKIKADVLNYMIDNMQVYTISPLDLVSLLNRKERELSIAESALGGAKTNKMFVRFKPLY